MTKHDYILAIDPDVDKSGVAVIRTSDKYISCECLTFPKLLDHILFCKEMAKAGNKSIIVIVEAGWLISHNWHLNGKDNRRTASAKGNATGRNHETGRKIVEMCKHYGLDVVEQKPLKKCWNGTDGKITQEEIEHFIPAFPKRSNQEVRDAALIAWNYAGFPIRVKSATWRKGRTLA